jgi:hypothetical protein
MVLRVAVLLALILGILFWTNVSDSTGLMVVHGLIGIVVVLSLWVLGISQALEGGSFGLAVATFVLGFLVLLIGLFQMNWLPGSYHWIIQVIHLLLGLSAIGLGEMIGGRHKRMLAAKAAS